MKIFTNTGQSKKLLEMLFVLLPLTIIVQALLNSQILYATSIEEQMKKECAGCHALSAPDSDLLTERMTRIGPPLYYAGSKYNADWMETWLQAPKQVRPGGVFFAQHTVVTDEGDVIDPSTLTTHPVLSSAKASAMTRQLMTLVDKENSQTGYIYKPKKSSLKMGAMNFGKFKGCRACHQDEKDYGGVSGPELHTVFTRLKPEFIASYIRDPQQWEPRSLMPNKQLKDNEIQKLMDYLKLLGDER